MKRIYQLSLSLLVLTSGIIIAMDDEGQNLMNAIRTSNVNDVDTILYITSEFINVCQKVGDKSPVGLAYELSQGGLNEDATKIRIAVIDYAFDHFVEITRDQSPPPSLMRLSNTQKNIDEFINLMVRCSITQEEVITRTLCICSTQEWAVDYISTLISYPLSKNALKNCPTLLSDLIIHHPDATGWSDNGKNHSLGLWVLWCIRHGAPVDISNKDGITPLIAILGSCKIINPAYDSMVRTDLAKISDVIEILLTCGANPNQEYLFENVRHTLITYVSGITQNLTLFDYNSQGVVVVGSRKKAPDILSCPKGAHILNLLRNTIKPSIPPQYQVSGLKYLQTNINKTVFATIATVIGLYVGYKWVTSRWTAQEPKNILINNTGLQISIKHNTDTSVSKGINETYELPEDDGKLIIKYADTGESTKDLEIDLDQYTDYLDDYYINITIRPTKWFERVFVRSPLYYSVTWKRKPTTQEAK